MRRFVFFATLLLAVGVAFYLWPRSRTPTERTAADARAMSTSTNNPGAGAQVQSPASQSPSAASVEGNTRNAAGTGAAPGTTPSSSAPFSKEDFPIIAPLNTPNTNIVGDLTVVSQIFDAWLSNFPRDGNPVGENADITAALMGNNRLELALIPKSHPAVNANGELCDRWGTPFRFHQISGTKMEIRSAGPDRKFATEDDALWTPP
jgi:hypothetical protein